MAETTTAMPQLFPDTFAPRVPPGLIVDETRDAVFLLHPVQPRWALTNLPGLALARAFNGSLSIRDAARGIVQRHSLEDEAAVLGDVKRFVASLHEANLLENRPLEAAPAIPTKREPHRLTIYITEECNLRCKHCFVVEGRMPAPKLTGEEIRRLIDAHLDNHPQAVIMFSGGEALVREDCLELMRHAAARTDYVNLNTNGMLIDEKVSATLAELKVWIQVSLDGADPEMHNFLRGKGSFERTWNAIELLCRAGMARRLRTATTLTRCSVAHVRAVIERVDALGLYEMRFLALNRLKAATTNWEQIAPEPREMMEVYRYLLLEVPAMDPPLRTKIEGEFPGFVPFPDPGGKHWCPLGETTILDSQGYTYPCPSLLMPEYRTGNIYEQDLLELEEDGQARRLREQMLRRRITIEECTVCAWRNFCQGSCQAFSELRTGSPWINDEFCDFRRELYREHALLQASGRLRYKGGKYCAS